MLLMLFARTIANVNLNGPLHSPAVNLRRHSINSRLRVLKVRSLHRVPHFCVTVPGDLSCVSCLNYATKFVISLWKKSALSQGSFRCFSSGVIQCKANLIHFFSGHRHVRGLSGTPCCPVRVCT